VIDEPVLRLGFSVDLGRAARYHSLTEVFDFARIIWACSRPR
jgi:hypothetical protein